MLVHRRVARSGISFHKPQTVIFDGGGSDQWQNPSLLLRPKSSKRIKSRKRHTRPTSSRKGQIDERCQLTARSVEARSEARNPVPLEISRVDPVNENDSGLGYLVERSDAWKDHRRDFRCLPERSMVRKLRSLLLVRGGSCLQVVGELVELG